MCDVRSLSLCSLNVGSDKARKIQVWVASSTGIYLMVEFLFGYPQAGVHQA